MACVSNKQAVEGKRGDELTSIILSGAPSVTYALSSGESMMRNVLNGYRALFGMELRMYFHSEDEGLFYCGFSVNLMEVSEHLHIVGPGTIMSAST